MIYIPGSILHLGLHGPEPVSGHDFSRAVGTTSVVPAIQPYAINNAD